MEAPLPARDAPTSVLRYALGVLITTVAIVSQYVVPETWPAARAVYGNLPGDLAIVYGVPIVAFALLVGAGPLRAWRARLRRATVEGLGWFGAMTLLGLAVAFLLVIVYAAVDPGALHLLERANPALEGARHDIAFYVAFAFAVGAFEETIFRGWVFGFWRSRPVGWIAPAVGSSALFAGVHLYYGLTYGAISPIFYVNLFLLGFAFAATYRASGGNLVVPAVLHGANDATAFLTVSPWPVLGVASRYGLVGVGAVIALILYVQRSASTGPPAPPPAGAA